MNFAHPATFRNSVLYVSNRQESRPINLVLFRRIVSAVLKELLKVRYDLGVHLVSVAEITWLNETFLHHRGPTDVIAFDYGGDATSQRLVATVVSRRLALQRRALLHGEIFICVQEAMKQAQRFHTTWQSEVARYAIHGVLHLCGYDDRQKVKRLQMKREEDHLLKQICRKFDVAALKRRLKA